jgi:kumamolisin
VFGPGVRAHASAGQPPSGYFPASGTPAGCAAGVGSGGFTPNQYLSAYNYSPLRRAGLDGRGERVALIEIDGFRYPDIRTFARCFGLDIPRLSVFFVGSPHGLPPGGETTLDLEVLDAVAPDLDSIEVYENGGDAVNVFKSFVLPLIAPGAKPQVVSASLGLCEQFLAGDFGRARINGIQRDMELATATGITLLASSGDTGSAGCVGQGGHVLDELNVSYPASSEFVTGVGGTNVLLSPANQIAGQVVWNDTSVQLSGGGGGLSELFPRPPYQNGVVGVNHRAVPDVSMLADVAPGYAIFCTAPTDPLCANSPPWHTVGGTSAAAPLLAGGVALVNQDLRRHQREYLGLMNPLLYAIGRSSIHARVFDDVSQIGDDVGPFIPGSGGQPLGCCSAVPGYDDASGWGSVDLAGLDRVALAVLPRYGNVALSIPRAQHPLAGHALKVKLFCSRRCAAYAFAVVTIGSGSAFTARSGTFHFHRKGAKVIPIRFTGGQESRIRSGLARGRRVEAEAFAVALDARGQIAKVTPGRVIRIRG